MRTIYIMSGLPGSGKTTWVKNHAHWGDYTLHRDELREVMREEMGLAHAHDVPRNKEYERWLRLINDVLDTSPANVFYIDQTTLCQGALNKLLNGIRESLSPNDNIIIQCIHTSFNICDRRNEARTGDAHVPDATLSSMARTASRDPINLEKTRKAFPELHIAIVHDNSMEGL